MTIQTLPPPHAEAGTGGGGPLSHPVMAGPPPAMYVSPPVTAPPVGLYGSGVSVVAGAGGGAGTTGAAGGAHSGVSAAAYQANNGAAAAAFPLGGGGHTFCVAAAPPSAGYTPNAGFNNNGNVAGNVFNGAPSVFPAGTRYFSSITKPCSFMTKLGNGIDHAFDQLPHSTYTKQTECT